MCIPTFVDFFLFNLFFFLFLCFFRFLFPSFLFSLLAGSLLHFFFFLLRPLASRLLPPSIHSYIFFFIRFFFHPGHGTIVKSYTLTPTTLSQSSNHVFFLAGRWSTSGWGGNAHFFTYTRIRSRETGEHKQTNKHEQTWG